MNNLEYISYQLFSIYCSNEIKEKKYKILTWEDYYQFSLDIQALTQSKFENIYIKSIKKFPSKFGFSNEMCFEAFYYSIQLMAKMTYPNLSTPINEFVNHFLIPLLIIHGENEEGINLLESLKPFIIIYSDCLKHLYNHFRVGNRNSAPKMTLTSYANLLRTIEVYPTQIQHREIKRIFYEILKYFPEQKKKIKKYFYI